MRCPLKFLIVAKQLGYTADFTNALIYQNYILGDFKDPFHTGVYTLHGLPLKSSEKDVH